MWPSRLVQTKKDFGYALNRPQRGTWGYRPNFIWKKCFWETPYPSPRHGQCPFFYGTFTWGPPKIQGWIVVQKIWNSVSANIDDWGFKFLLTNDRSIKFLPRRNPEKWFFIHPCTLIPTPQTHFKGHKSRGTILGVTLLGPFFQRKIHCSYSM